MSRVKAAEDNRSETRKEQGASSHQQQLTLLRIKRLMVLSCKMTHHISHHSDTLSVLFFCKWSLRFSDLSQSAFRQPHSLINVNCSHLLTMSVCSFPLSKIAPAAAPPNHHNCFHLLQPGYIHLHSFQSDTHCS